MSKLIELVHAKEWTSMERSDQGVALHMLERQLSTLSNTIALDINADLHRYHVPAHVEVVYRLVVDPGKDPRHDA
jgi:hypothetical protein